MKVLLNMTLSLNGLVAQHHEGHPIPKEVVDDLGRLVARTGNLVVGRRTFEGMGSYWLSQKGVEIVVVSNSTLPATERLTVVKSPHQAIEHLEGRGSSEILVGGGAQLYSSFLSLGIVDEIYLNVSPTVQSKGLPVKADGEFYFGFRLAQVTKLTEDIVQLHYKRDKSGAAPS